MKSTHSFALEYFVSAYIIIGVGRGGPGGARPLNNLKGGGANIPFAPPPPNNPPIFSFNYYVKQEKSQMCQVEGENNKKCNFSLI